MIEKIIIKNVASFNALGAEINHLKPINFFYGANGSGKTTISRIIAQPTTYPDAKIEWRDGLPLRCDVYNRDFVDFNFSGRRELKGIFTLGEDAVNTKKTIEHNQQEAARLQHEISVLNQDLHNKQQAKTVLEQQFENNCWFAKVKYNDIFKDAFDGARSSKHAFANKCKSEKNNTAQLFPYEYLKEKADKIFHGDKIKLQNIPPFSFNEIEGFENNLLLTTRIVGKDNIDIAHLYKKLGNTDWVKKGRSFLQTSENQCPFCQQKTIDSHFLSELEAYFDESYVTQTNNLLFLKDSYTIYVNSKIGYIGEVIKMENQYIDKKELKELKEAMETTLRANLALLENKIKEPSIVVRLDSLFGKFKAFADHIGEINKRTNEHNRIIDNLAIEKRQLKHEIWRFIVDVLRPILINYDANNGTIDKAIANLTASIASKAQKLYDINTETAILFNKVTSVRPTVNKINSLLASFAFNGFLLSEDAVNQGQYQIIRKNGEPTGRSLSEGEKTFITFLYFYHLLMGSQESGTIPDDRIVVFDDPISSLDSNVIFIVSHLIRKLIDDVRNKKGNIKQIFILTHNTYFHKEVSFNNGKGIARLLDESFWLVTKENETTKVIPKPNNPVKNSYEVLWEEVREKKDGGSITMRNTLRRILEDYFTILGNIGLEKIVDEFDNEEKIICGSLISWLHNGPRFITESLHVDTSPATEKNYFNVFREIFNKTGHEAHYRMMMREA